MQQAEEPSEPIQVLGHFWPGLKLGDMVFSRAGVRVLGGSEHLAKQVAENSTLYFTHRRLHRQTRDLSMGWVSNSQWGTDYRRDYETNGKRFYHSQGVHLVGHHPPYEDELHDLMVQERIELCQNRCFVRTRKDDTDLWPYDDRWEESV